MEYKKIQEAEANSWNMPNSTEKERKDKSEREKVRYYMMAKQMGLTFLDTSDKIVWDLGCGGVGGVSTVIPCKKRVPIDPLTDEYSKVYDTTGYWKIQAEDIKEKFNEPDLLICSNALDHMENPRLVLQDIDKYAKYSCYVSMFHAENNALSHPHECHEHNINWQVINDHLNENWELIWKLDYKNDYLTYGWKKQPAFAFLMRRINQPKFLI